VTVTRRYNPARMKSRVTTPDAYVKSLPADRRDAIRAVRATILKHLPKGYEETVDFGMLTYVVPLKRYPDTYNGRPLAIAALASQKQYLSLYLMCVYGSAALKTWFASEFKKAGKKLDMGKPCVRFKSVDDLPLDVVGKAIARVSVGDFLRIYERSRRK
jgi:hypothetical protein